MRNLGIDLLRLLAVLLVLGRHLTRPADSNVFLDVWHQGGWVGVDLFFVLSGFLVSSLLFTEHQRTGTLNVARFLIRRAFKIYPAFWAFLAISVCVKTLLRQPPSLQAILVELLFIQNYIPGIFSHTWSLAVEEHFYIGLAALFAYLSRLQDVRCFQPIPTLFAVIATTCLIARVLNLHYRPAYSHYGYLFATHLRIDSLFFGVLLSYGYHYWFLERRLAPISTIFLLSVGGLLLSPAFIFPLEEYKWVSVIGVIFFYVGSGLILLAAMRLQASQNRVLLILGSLGAASYSIYLWHMAINQWGTHIVAKCLGTESFATYFTTYVGGSLCFGYVMNRAIERQMLLVRDTLVPSLSATKLSQASTPRVESMVTRGGARQSG